MSHPPFSHLVVTQGRYSASIGVSGVTDDLIGDAARMLDADLHDRFGFLDPSRTWRWIDRHAFLDRPLGNGERRG